MTRFTCFAAGCLLSTIAGCSASGGDQGGVSNPASDASVAPDVSVDAFSVESGGDQGLTPDTGCATSVSEAKQAPAAMLVVLDRSSSMSKDQKFAQAAMAIVQAIDQDVFDSMWLGLYSAPSGTVAGPQCIFGVQVPCMAPPFPQIDLQFAGAEKSGDNSGVRRTIKDWLTFNAPAGGLFDGDASPMYWAVQASIDTLQVWPESGKRILLLVTDGTLSCNQFTTLPGFPDCNGCDHDWVDPNSIVQLLADANADAQKPVDSFVVGVPGADTYDPQGCTYPPYHMRLALSAMAYAGSPANVDPACTGTTFTQAGADPAVPCHFDMTTGNFGAQALADTISQIRGRTLGCTYELPVPEAGTVNPNLVNVESSVGGGSPTQIPKRSDPADPCTSDGCWDYDADGNVVLVGKACDDVKNATDAKVQIVVGCQTVAK